MHLSKHARFSGHFSFMESAFFVWSDHMQAVLPCIVAALNQTDRDSFHLMHVFTKSVTLSPLFSDIRYFILDQ